MHQPDRGHQHGSASNAISNASVKVVRDYTGRGPTKARTTISRDLVTIVFQDTMTKAERVLVEAGKADLVLQMRQEFQRAMREDLVAIVESNIDRKVIAFMSDNHIDPDMAAETFVLEPQSEANEDGKEPTAAG